MNYEDDRQQTEFNNAFGIIQTIQRCYEECNASRVKPYDIHTWSTALDNLFMTLSTSMKDAERIILFEELRKIRESVNTLSVVQNKVYRANRKHIGVPMQLFETMLGFELKLRKIAKDSGLEMRVLDDAMKALR